MDGSDRHDGNRDHDAACRTAYQQHDYGEFCSAVLALIFGYVTRITFLTAAGTLCIGLGIWSRYLGYVHSEKEVLDLLELRNSLIDGMTSIIFTITALTDRAFYITSLRK